MLYCIHAKEGNNKIKMINIEEHTKDLNATVRLFYAAYAEMDLASGEGSHVNKRATARNFIKALRNYANDLEIYINYFEEIGKE